MAVETEFQKTVYNTLTGNAGLVAAVAGIYDRPPQATDSGSLTAFPYVVIGETVLTMEDTFSEYGFSALLRVHVFSRSGSYKECKTVQGLIYSLLHNASLTVTGFNCYSILRETSQVILGPDGEMHGVCEYRALMNAD